MADEDINLAKDFERLHAELATHTQQNAAQHINTVNAVLNLPPFLLLKQVDWLFQIKAAFHSRHTTSKCSRYMNVLQKLPVETITSILDIIRQQATLATPTQRYSRSSPTHLVRQNTICVMSCLISPPWVQ